MQALSFSSCQLDGVYGDGGGVSDNGKKAHNGFVRHVLLLQESGVTYQVRLVNGLRVRVNVFVVYNHPREVETEDGEIEYEWPSISRRACPKDHCEASLLHSCVFSKHVLSLICVAEVSHSNALLPDFCMCDRQRNTDNPLMLIDF